MTAQESNVMTPLLWALPYTPKFLPFAIRANGGVMPEG
jgi:hypothetical protein